MRVHRLLIAASNPGVCAFRARILARLARTREMPTNPENLLSLLDEVQSIARSGLDLTTNPFDRERYQRLVDLVSSVYAPYVDLPPKEVRSRWARELGIVTPKVGAEAVVFDEEGRLLLLRRSDDGSWGLPGGWLEPNETPAECARREAREETGLELRILRLVDVFTRKAGAGAAPQATVAIVYLCDIASGAVKISHESTEIAYMHLDEVPTWHGWHREHAETARRLWESLRTT